MDKKKLLVYILTGLMIALSLVLCLFIFIIEPPYKWLTSVLFAGEGLVSMGIALLRKSEHYKVEFFSSLATFLCFAVMAILEIL